MTFIWPNVSDNCYEIRVKKFCFCASHMYFLSSSSLYTHVWLNVQINFEGPPIIKKCFLGFLNISRLEPQKQTRHQLEEMRWNLLIYWWDKKIADSAESWNGEENRSQPCDIVNVCLALFYPLLPGTAMIRSLESWQWCVFSVCWWVSYVLLAASR